MKNYTEKKRNIHPVKYEAKLRLAPFHARISQGRQLNRGNTTAITASVTALIFVFAFLYLFSGAFGGTKINLTLNTNPDLQNGLVGHWTFDGDVETQITDSSSNTNHAFASSTVSATSSLVTGGKVGQALNFDGVDDYIAVQDHASLDFGSGDDITLSTWLKLDNGAPSGTYKNLFVKGNGLSENYGVQLSNSNNMSFFHRGGGTWQIYETDNTYYSPGEWIHVSITHTFGTGSSLKFYINGEEVTGAWTSGTGNETPTEQNEELTIGAVLGSGFAVTEPFRGILDDVRIYNRALTASEVSRLYDLGATTKINKTIARNPDLENGLVAHYTFDGTNMDLSSSTSEVKDSGPNSFDGDWMLHATNTSIGKIGQGIYFDGVDDVVGLGTQSELNLTGDYTIATWFKYDSIPGNWPSFYMDGLYGLTFGLCGASCGGGDVYLESWIDDANAILADTLLQADRWYHGVLVDNGTARVFYLDGEFDGSGASVTMAGHGVAYLGGRLSEANSFFHGTLDDMRIYDRALSTSTIKRLYQLGATTKINKTLKTVSPLEDGLVGHWTFDTLSTGLASNTAEVTDESGNDNRGDWQNHASTTKPGKLGQAIEFDGVDDIIDVEDPGTDSIFDFGDNDEITLSAWIKPDSLSGCCSAIVEKYSGGNFNYGFQTINDDIDFFYTGSGIHQYRSYDYVTVGEWIHFVFTYTFTQGSTATFYVNGVEDTGAMWHINDGLDSPDESNGPVSIGANDYTGDGSPDEEFDGAIDDVRIYNRTLSADEIMRLYQLGQ